MNPLIWKLIADLYAVRAQKLEHGGEKLIGRSEEGYIGGETDEEFNIRMEEKQEQAYRELERLALAGDKEAQEELRYSWENPNDPPPWKEIQAYLTSQDQEKKETRKLKKSSKGHSGYGRGGGTIPMDVLESKTTPRGLLGPKKRKY